MVLVDFWTYSCINCIRTLPYLKELNAKFAADGLVIVGVHTPEFEFEKSRDNVAQAISQYGIKYLVAQDNDYATWQAYDNLYWPAKYLIDANGHVRYTHFGEGQYAETEAAVASLLSESGQQAVAPGAGPADYTLAAGRSPEMYLGDARSQNLASPERYTVGVSQQFSLPPQLPLNRFAFAGQWTVGEENATAAAGARLELRFVANDVYLVLVPPAGGDEVTVMLDGRPIAASAAGEDVRDATVTVDASRLYHLVNLRGAVGEHTLSLVFRHGQTGAFAFTFG